MRFNPFCLAAGLIWLTVAICTQVSFGQPAPCAKSSALCGPQCLLAVCRKLEVAATLEELIGLSGYDEKTGVTMAGLQKAAVSKGLQALGVKISVDELAGLAVPAIAYLWDNHFVVVEPGDADTLKVTDPPAEPKAVKKDDFKKAYSGFALLLSKDPAAFPKPAANGPDIRFDRYALDFGAVYQGEKPDCVFKVRNAGSAELLISKIEPSCSCLVVVAAPEKLAPGGEGEIKLIFDSAGLSHFQEKQVFVTSNDPISPIVPLEITGIVKSTKLRFSPRTIDFGAVRRSDSAAREVYVPSTPEQEVRVISVSSDSAFVEAAVSANADKQRPGWLVTAKLKPGTPLGNLTGSVTVISDHPKEPAARIPVTAIIKGNLDLDRDSFFFGLVKKGSEARAAITISNAGRSPLKVIGVDNPVKHIAIKISPNSDGSGGVLTATLKSDAPVGLIRGEVTVHTSDPDQPEIRVPVFGLVEEPTGSET